MFVETFFVIEVVDMEPQEMEDPEMEDVKSVDVTELLSDEEIAKIRKELKLPVTPARDVKKVMQNIKGPKLRFLMIPLDHAKGEKRLYNLMGRKNIFPSGVVIFLESKYVGMIDQPIGIKHKVDYIYEVDVNDDYRVTTFSTMLLMMDVIFHRANAVRDINGHLLPKTIDFFGMIAHLSKVHGPGYYKSYLKRRAEAQTLARDKRREWDNRRMKMMDLQLEHQEGHDEISIDTTALGPRPKGIPINWYAEQARRGVAREAAAFLNSIFFYYAFDDRDVMFRKNDIENRLRSLLSSKEAMKAQADLMLTLKKINKKSRERVNPSPTEILKRSKEIRARTKAMREVTAIMEKTEDAITFISPDHISTTEVAEYAKYIRGIVSRLRAYSNPSSDGVSGDLKLIENDISRIVNLSKVWLHILTEDPFARKFMNIKRIETILKETEIAKMHLVKHSEFFDDMLLRDVANLYAMSTLARRRGVTNVIMFLGGAHISKTKELIQENNLGWDVLKITEEDIIRKRNPDEYVQYVLHEIDRMKKHLALPSLMFGEKTPDVPPDLFF